MHGRGFVAIILIISFLSYGCDYYTNNLSDVSDFSVGGLVVGLQGELTLEIKNNQVITVNQNGDFRFTFPLSDSSDYFVAIINQPEGQVCTVSNERGAINSRNVTNVKINCLSVFKSFVGTIYGDSQADGGVVPPQGWMGETLNLQTDKNLILNRNAVGGYDLQSIRVLFESEFPKPGENYIIVEGGINDIINTGGSLERMKNDISFIADTVIKAGLKLVVVNVPPWKGHRLHTNELQLLTDQYNDWLGLTYPDYIADIYSALEDPENPDQLLPIYSASYPAITNLHISRSGMRKVDEVIGQFFDFNNPGKTILNANDLFPFTRELSSWSVQEVERIGGDSILGAGSKLNSSQGLISTIRNERHGIQASFSGAPENTSVELSYIVRAGDKQWIRSSFTNMSGIINMSYIDVINLNVINYTGVIQSVMKYSPGWIKISIITNTGSGSDINLSIMAANGDADNYFIGDAGTSDIYIDLVQMLRN